MDTESRSHIEGCRLRRYFVMGTLESMSDQDACKSRSRCIGILSICSLCSQDIGRFGAITKRDSGTKTYYSGGSYAHFAPRYCEV